MPWLGKQGNSWTKALLPFGLLAQRIADLKTLSSLNWSFHHGYPPEPAFIHARLHYTLSMFSQFHSIQLHSASDPLHSIQLSPHPEQAWSCTQKAPHWPPPQPPFSWSKLLCSLYKLPFLHTKNTCCCSHIRQPGVPSGLPVLFGIRLSGHSKQVYLLTLPAVSSPRLSACQLQRPLFFRILLPTGSN